MKQVIAVMPLPEWEIDGKRYTPSERIYTSSPPGFDQHVGIGVGSWFELPSTDAGIKFGARLKQQNGVPLETKPGEVPRFDATGTHPTLQRFAFEIREVGDAGDSLDEVFADTPIKKLDGTTSENPWKAARGQIEKLTAEKDALAEENAALKAEVEKLTADHAKKGGKK